MLVVDEGFANSTESTLPGKNCDNSLEMRDTTTSEQQSQTDTFSSAYQYFATGHIQEALDSLDLNNSAMKEKFLWIEYGRANKSKFTVTSLGVEFNYN